MSTSISAGELFEQQRDRLGLRWLHFAYDRRAWRELGLTRAQWLYSLLEAPRVYELFSWTDPAPFARYWTTRIRAALGRRMHRWLATAS